MPRDANGVYSLPPAYLAVTGNTIAAPMQGTLRINTDAPTLALQDTDGRSGFLNVNGGVFSVQRGAANGTIWDAGPNGRAPLTVNLENGNVAFSGAFASYGTSTSNGNIEIKGAWPTLALQKSAADQANGISGYAIDGKLRWNIALGNAVAEGAGNSGADFAISRFTGNDVFLGVPLFISRSTGVMTLSARPAWAGFTPWDNNNFDPGTKVSKTGDTMTGNLTIANTGPALSLADTDNSTRYVQNNGGLIGFLGSDANWRLRVDDAGAVWTAQWGDLSTRIEDRASAYASAAASSRVAKTGDTMTGPLQIGFNAPYFDLVYGGVMRLRQIVDGNGTWIVRNGDNNDNFFYVSTSGAVWTKQFGDLNSRIETRADSWSATRREEAKSWSYINLMQETRLAGGGDVTASVNAWAGTGSGDVITGIHWSSVNSQIVDVVRVKSLQALRNGSWFTIGTI
jgi:hypothetical protein